MRNDDIYSRDIFPFLQQCGALLWRKTLKCCVPLLVGYSTLKLERPGDEKFDGCTLSFKRDKFQPNPEYNELRMNYGADYLIRDNVGVLIWTC